MYDTDRGTSAQRGYNSKRWLSTKRTVRKRDRFCMCEAENCHPGRPGSRMEAYGFCMRTTTVADHYPRSRKELLALGIKDPDKPEYCRGLCASCHSRETQRNPKTRGGWAAR